MTGAARRWAATTAAVVMAVGAVGACTKETGSQAAFCREVKRTPTIYSVVTGLADAEPTALAARLDEASAAFDTLEDAAPAEVRDSVTEMTSLVDAVIAAVKRHPDDPEAVATELRSVVKDHPGAAAASLKVATYASKNCGVQLNPTVDEPAATTTAASTPTTTEPPG